MAHVSGSADLPGPAPAVADFIAERQVQVLARAVESLAEADLDALPTQVHRLWGTLGSYQLPEASALLEPLHRAVAAGGSADLEQLRRTAVQGLSALHARLAAGASLGAVPSTAAPLDGVLVADFTRVLAGPYATMLLADLGATVIKVESPGGDDTRAWVPPVRDGVSTYYLGINRNKRSIVLDLADAADAADARRLARRADVVIENFRVGGLQRFGLDYDSVRQINPQVIYASISGFGATGGAHMPGYDLMVQAMSGLMSLTGDPDGPAQRAGVAVVDVLAGLHVTVGILAALNHRHETGEGQHVEVNLMSSALSGLVNHTSAVLAAGVVPHRMGNGHPSLFPYDPFRASDGDIVLMAGNNPQFAALCRVLDCPDLAEDPRFATNADRTAHREQLRPLLAERVATHTVTALFDALIAAGVPSAPILTIGEGVELAAALGLEPVVEVGAGDRRVPTMRTPISFSNSALRYTLPPPELGEHTDELRAWLRSEGEHHV